MISFFKYQGAGNDFIMIDNRSLHFPKEKELIASMCHRRFGIGADGLILLENDTDTDFRMVYYNSDGSESTMCGNGGRCIVRFAFDIGIIGNQTVFNAIDGKHYAEKIGEEIKLQMIDVQEVVKNDDDTVFLNSGSPHHIKFVEDLKAYDIVAYGKEIRYSERYAPNGTNVNIVAPIAENHLEIFTYERGVEDETLACGTGATAAAIAWHYMGKTTNRRILLEAKGGSLEVTFDIANGVYSNVYLKGGATAVFEGVWR